MARQFVDTSALVKLYRNEPRTAEVQGCVGPKDVLVLSGIAFLEFQSAFFGLVRQRLMNRSDAEQRIALLKQDIPNFESIPLAQSLVSMAEVLISQFGMSEGLRPADALQLACALRAQNNSPLDAILTTDGVLSRCAVASGLVVKP